MQNKEMEKKKHVDFKTFMLMVWIFIKALVIPKYAYRFRNMYLVMPVLLLIISWAILPIPIQSYMMKNGKSEYQKQNINNTSSLYKLSDEEFEKLKALKIRFDLKVMYADDESIDNKEIILTEGNNKWYFVVDLCELDEKRTSDVHYDFSNFFDTYRNDEGTNTLIVLYNSKYLVRINGKSNYYYYQADTVDVSNIDVDTFCDFLVDGMVSSTVNTYGWYAALYALIIPVALSLFSFILLKSTSRIKQFKNYFNVAGITSVVPTLLIFGLSWLLPTLSLIQYYAPLYVIYYFFFIGIISFKKNKVRIIEQDSQE